MKLKDLIFEENNEVVAAAKAINDAIISVDDSMHYGVFAKAVAHILKDEYGPHNIKPFMDEFHAALGVNEADNNLDLESKVKGDLIKHLAEYKPHVRIINKLGKISFLHKDSLPEDAWKKVEDIIKQYGGKITNSSNWYDEEPGERNIYPDIKFEIS